MPGHTSCLKLTEPAKVRESSYPHVEYSFESSEPHEYLTYP
jgi:hypothetical protein